MFLLVENFFPAAFEFNVSGDEGDYIFFWSW